MCGTYLGSRTRKARKWHRCCACDVPIPPGFQYEVSCDIDDGKARSSKWHSECRTEFDRMLSEQHDDCGDPSWTWDGGMPPEIKQKYVFGPPEPTEKQWEEIEFPSDTEEGLRA